jgi:hypothetical protein
MKNQDILLIVLLGILGFMLWNKSVNERFVDVSSSTPVSPSVIQNIVTAVQMKDPDLYPLQTVYINPFGGDQGSIVYNARMMFMNTRGYFGVQYDIQADAAGKILSMNVQAPPDASGPFGGFVEDKLSTFEDIQVVLDKQFADLKTQAPGYQGKLEAWLATTSAEQRDKAFSDAAGKGSLSAAFP